MSHSLQTEKPSAEVWIFFETKDDFEFWHKWEISSEYAQALLSLPVNAYSTQIQRLWKAEWIPQEADRKLKMDSWSSLSEKR